MHRHNINVYVKPMCGGVERCMHATQTTLGSDFPRGEDTGTYLGFSVQSKSGFFFRISRFAVFSVKRYFPRSTLSLRNIITGFMLMGPGSPAFFGILAPLNPHLNLTWQPDVA